MIAIKCQRVAVPLTAILAVAVVLLAGCASTPPSDAVVRQPSSSAGTADQRAATMAWFDATNSMWTRHDFNAVDNVTIGAMRTIYQHEATTTDGATGRKKLTLNDLSITIPCQTTSPSVFVAYARTNVFTLGDGVQSAAMVFQQDGPTWKLAAAITHLDGPSWPALCQQSCPTVADAKLAPYAFDSTLAGVLSNAATGRTPTAAQGHPFAVNSFLSGTGSVSDQSATSLRDEQNAGDRFTSTFTTTTAPTFAFPLADNSGYWIIGTLEQHDELDSAAGLTAKTWPDGDQVDTPHPATVHHQTDEFLTSYAAIDPANSVAGLVTLDGFFGWPIAANAG
jgi:hypothetical protein